MKVLKMDEVGHMAAAWHIREGLNAPRDERPAQDQVPEYVLQMWAQRERKARRHGK